MVLLLLAAVLGAELFMRLVETRLSRDLANIRNLPAVAEAMSRHQGETILIAGNSLTRRAVDEKLLAEGLAASGWRNPGVFFFTPDATNMINWDYGLRLYFFNHGHRPGQIILGAGPLHVWDSQGDASRLAAYYVDASDMRRAWQEDLHGWEQRCEFLLSRISVLHASRARIKPHVFGALIPHYFDIEQWVNTQRDVARQRLGKLDASQRTHRHLTALLDECRRQQTRLTIMAVPLPEPYQMQTSIVTAIQSGGGRWLDLSSNEGLAPANFPDGYHLDDAGAKVFTRRLVEALVP